MKERIGVMNISLKTDTYKKALQLYKEAKQFVLVNKYDEHKLICPQTYTLKALQYYFKISYILDEQIVDVMEV